MSVAEISPTTSLVRRQYEALPYPHRNPADDERTLFVTSLDDLGAINFYCYRGRRSVRQGFRCLVAGGGTGDAVMYLAHQLRGTDATITYLDLSDASQQIARERARFSGMSERILWRQGSLLDLASMKLGEFDYINCSGVLHHLDDPLAGLLALKSVLKPDGAMGIMLYAGSGRTGVYQMQDLMRLVCRGVDDRAEMLRRTRAVLSVLPETNWFRRGAALFSERMDDAELYDLFLHSRDQAFTAAQVHDLVARAGLNFVEHTSDDRALYEPDLAFNDPHVRAAVRGLSPGQQQAAAELFWGAIARHSFWITPSADTRTELSDRENVPFFSRLGRRARVRETILASAGGLWSHKISHAGGIELTLQLQAVPAVTRFIELIDDRRTMGEIVETVRSEYDPVPPASEVWQTCLYVLDTLLRDDCLLLRHRSVEPFVTN